MLSSNSTDTTSIATLPISEVERVLDSVRPTLARHGGGIELVCVEGCNVHVVLRGACVGCPSSLMTLRDSVERQFRQEIAGFGELITDEPPTVSSRFSSALKRLVARDPISR